jgi:predicted GNAT family acetyltransferase
VNPANFYSSNPFSGDSALVPILLANGCELCEFRCVWYRTCETAHATAEALPSVRIFDETDIDDYIALSKQVESEQDWQAHEIAIRTAAAQMGWYYFVAFEQDKPIATASLYQTGSLGYLAQAYTHLDHRRRGAHARLIQARVQHAHALGCHGVFSVTDSHTQSARDLQRMNFILAYNYLLFVRSPIPNKL